MKTQFINGRIFWGNRSFLIAGQSPPKNPPIDSKVLACIIEDVFNEIGMLRRELQRLKDEIRGKGGA